MWKRILIIGKPCDTPQTGSRSPKSPPRPCYIIKVGEGDTSHHNKPTVVYLFYFIMQFLQNVRTMDTSLPVVLTVNTESVQIPFENARGKSVSQLFAEYGSSLGVDVARITTYVINGESVPSDTQPRPGETVRGAITSESKG